jgi:hypothetical protein
MFLNEKIYIRKEGDEEPFAGTKRTLSRKEHMT